MRILLHIGGEKTGTTTLQWTLSQAYPDLVTAGVLYPKAFGDLNHVKAYAYASESPLDEIKAPLGLEDGASLSAFRENLAASLLEEVQRTRPETLIVSNEHLSSRLRQASEIQRLKDLLSDLPGVSGIRVIYYARPQWDLVGSIYSTYIKTGGLLKLEDPVERFCGNVINHLAIYERWVAAFGQDACEVIPYEKGAASHDDIVGHLCERFGIARPEVQAARRNPKLSAAAAEFLRLFNREVPRSIKHRFNPLRGNIQDLMERLDIGPDLQPPAPLSEAIHLRYAPMNEEFSRRYLGGQPLFTSAPPSPESLPSSPYELTMQDAMAIFATCWTEKQAQVIQQRRTIERLRSRS